MIRYGLQQHLLQDYLAFEETLNSGSWPGDGGVGGPASGQLYLYAKESGSKSRLFYKSDDGTEYGPLDAPAVIGAGTATRLAYWSDASTIAAAAGLTWDAGNSRLGIGTSSPSFLSHIVSESTAQKLVIDNYNDTFATIINLRSARNTLASPSAINGADIGLGRISFSGYTSAGAFSNQSAIIQAISAEAFTNIAQGCTLRFMTTAIGSATVTERFRIGASGQWGIGGATFGSSGDIFSSGGASAAPTWVTRATLNAALDHGTMAGLTDDDHAGYALLAGRSGGQTLIGGTAAGDDLTLQSTSGNGSGDTILLKRGNNGAHTIGEFAVSSDTSVMYLGSHGASKQLSLAFRDNGTDKYIIFKSADNTNFNIFDSATSQLLLTLRSPDSLAAFNAIATVAVTATSSNATAIGLLVQPTFDGSGEGPWALSAQGLFKPSASITAAYANLSRSFADTLGVGVTISSLIGGYFDNVYFGNNGAVTDGYALYVAGPTATGSLKPTAQHGLFISNQGLAGITNGIGARIDLPTGATNNWVFQLPADATDPTGGGGAANGRIPCVIGGVTRYIPYY